MREDFKVVHLVSTDSGGAYRAANRINMALKQNGVNSSIVVLEKKHMDSPVIDVLNNKIELVLFKILRKIDSFRIKRMKLENVLSHLLLHIFWMMVAPQHQCKLSSL